MVICDSRIRNNGDTHAGEVTQDYFQDIRGKQGTEASRTDSSGDESSATRQVKTGLRVADDQVPGHANAFTGTPPRR